MIERTKSTPAQAAANAAAWPRTVGAWYASLTVGGLAFGLIGERRPFGTGFFAHPLVVFAIAIVVALLALRVALARPVPQAIPERTLLIGCAAGLAAFLIGNFVSAHVLALFR